MTDEVMTLFQIRAKRQELDEVQLSAEEAMHALAIWLNQPDTSLSLLDLSALLDVGATLYRQSQLDRVSLTTSEDGAK